jgi:RNA polymerase sigma factor (sigma-70 family)
VGGACAPPAAGALSAGARRRRRAPGCARPLADDDRLVIGLYYLHGLSQAEIARRLDVSQVQISRRLARILARLRSLAANAE